jgi:hypothetical protein
VTAQDPTDTRRDAPPDAAPTRLQARLADPATEAQLLDLLDQADTLAGLLVLARGFIARTEEILDNVTVAVRDLAQAVTLDPALKLAAQSAVTLGEGAAPLAAKVGSDDVFERLADSPLTDHDALAILTRVADAVGRTAVGMRDDPPAKKRGFFSLPGLLRDPDFNRGAEFFIRLTRAVGAELDPQALADLDGAPDGAPELESGTAAAEAAAGLAANVTPAPAEDDADAAADDGVAPNVTGATDAWDESEWSGAAEPASADSPGPPTALDYYNDALDDDDAPAGPARKETT